MSKLYEAFKKSQAEMKQETLSEFVARSMTQPSSRDKGSVPVVGTVSPLQKERRKSIEPIPTDKVGYRGFHGNLVVFSDPQSAEAEQFRKIRAVLYQLRKARGCKSIMVTSALPQEGKTVIACNLVTAIIQGLDDRAFLLDCDLKRPGVHHLFGVNGKPGLTEFLTDKRDLTNVIHEVQGLDLKIIPAGTDPEYPGELLSSDKMANLLQELRAKYEEYYIILDTAPILLAAEVRVLAQLVDGIILVLLAEKTPRDLVQKALKEIPKDKIIGIVVNGVQSKKRYYSRSYSRY